MTVEIRSVKRHRSDNGTNEAHSRTSHAHRIITQTSISSSRLLARKMTSASSDTGSCGVAEAEHRKRQGEREYIDEADSPAKRLKNKHDVVSEKVLDAAGVRNASDAPFLVEGDAAEDKGARHTMEDASVVLLDASLGLAGKLRCMHFAIYDGHGGRLAAEYAQKHLHSNVVSAGLPRELVDVKTTKKAILEGFRKTEEDLLTESAAGGWLDGATAVCVWVLGKTVFIANIGDAKAVLARASLSDGIHDLNDTSSLKAIVLTREHKAIYPHERARIQKAGGSVGSNGRLQGRLEVSRAFGDRQFKKVGVIATPDINSFDLTTRDQFIILGCDGLWGVFGPIDAVNFVQKLLKDGLPTATISRCLVREAVRERRCKDNCTAIVIVFRHSCPL